MPLTRPMPQCRTSGPGRREAATAAALALPAPTRCTAQPATRAAPTTGPQAPSWPASQRCTAPPQHSVWSPKHCCSGCSAGSSSSSRWSSRGPCSSSSSSRRSPHSSRRGQGGDHTAAPAMCRTAVRAACAAHLVGRHTHAPPAACCSVASVWGTRGHRRARCAGNGAVHRLFIKTGFSSPKRTAARAAKPSPCSQWGPLARTTAPARHRAHHRSAPQRTRRTAPRRAAPRRTASHRAAPRRVASHLGAQHRTAALLLAPQRTVPPRRGAALQALLPALLLVGSRVGAGVSWGEKRMAHRPTCAGATYNAQKKRSMQPRWAATAIVAGGKTQLARIPALRRVY